MTFLKVFIQLLLLVTFGTANQAAPIITNHPLSNGRTVDIPEDMAERFQQLYTIMQTESAFGDHKVKFMINGFEYTAVLLGSKVDPETNKKIHHISFDPSDVRFVEEESLDEGFYIAVVSPEGDVEFEENFEVRSSEGVSRPATNGSGGQNNNGNSRQPGTGGLPTGKGNDHLGTAHEAGKSGGASAAGAKGLQLLLVPPSMLKEILGLKKEIEFQSKLFDKREKQFEEARKKEINEMVAVSVPALLQLANMQEISLDDVEFEDPEDFQFKTVDPDFLAVLQELNETLSSHQPRSQEEYLVKDIGLAAVQMADHSASADQSTEAEAYKAIATTAADVLVGIDPFTGIARDFTEFYSGKNMITGESLSSTERILSGVFFVAGLSTGGLVSSAKGITRAAVTIGKKVFVGRRYKRVFKSFDSLSLKDFKEVTAAIGDMAIGNIKPIQTPYGIVKQTKSIEALKLRREVLEGKKLYRIGTRNRSQSGKTAQFWATEQPFTNEYADKFGIPPENVRESNFVEKGRIDPDTNFIVRKAPGYEDHAGGGLEIVVEAGGVIVETHTSL